MTVVNQGRVQSGNGWVGRNTGETNYVLISGANSVWNIGGGLFVGNSSSGNRVTVANGGGLFSETGAIDSVNGRSNSVVVSGLGSIWRVNSSLAVGPGSSLNHLRIEDNGTVIAGALAVGHSGASISNTVTVVSGRLVVTNGSRTGTLTLREGALFLISADFLADRLQALSGTQSLISVASGNGNVRTLDLSAGTVARVGDGLNPARWQLGPTTHAFGSGVVIASNSTLLVAGTASGAITNSGLLEVGTNVAGFNLAGNLVQTRSGSLAFDIGGTVQRTGYDFIQADGAAQFDGTLRLRLANGFVPSSNSVFTLLSAPTIGGSFVNAPSGARITFEGTAVSCQVQYTGGNLRLSNFQNAGPAGTNDIDAAWAIRYFGHSPLTEDEREADSDGDGLTNYQEYRAGTNPLDGQSVLRILSVSRNLQGHAVIQFSSAPDRTYGVIFSTDLQDWQEVPAPVFASPLPGVFQWIDTGALTGPLGAFRSYRVLVR
jgi:T5SS/PEP-CTERM-associated repeat protein